MEQATAGRIASYQWRLNRVVRSETDAIALSLESAERDAATTLAAEEEDDRTDAVRRALPVRDPDALRKRLEDARLAAQILFHLSQVPGTDPVSDHHAEVALRFIADYCGGPPAPLPGRETAEFWTGMLLRKAMGRLCLNRALGDVISATIAYANDTALAADRRLARVQDLTAQLRRQRLVPDPTATTHIKELESHLNAQLDLALRQLADLQAARRQ
jgi:hypothetical protein